MDVSIFSFCQMITNFDLFILFLCFEVIQIICRIENRKWRNFNYKVDHSKYDTYSIGEKSGKDYVHLDNKPKNTKDLLK